MDYKDFLKVEACAGMQFTVDNDEYWLCQIDWRDAYLSGYEVKGCETLDDFNKLDVETEDTKDYRMLRVFGCSVVKRIFEPNKKENIIEKRTITGGNKCPNCGSENIEVVLEDDGCYAGCNFCQFYTPTIYPVGKELDKDKLIELERIENILIEVLNGITCGVKVPEYASKDE